MLDDDDGNKDEEQEPASSVLGVLMHGIGLVAQAVQREL